MIGYYVHHQGHGHRFRAAAIAAALDQPVTALSSLSIPASLSIPGSEPFAASVLLPRDDDAVNPRDVRAHDTLHWLPRHDSGLRARMAAIAQWVATVQPRAMVVDVSVEVAVFVRLLGVPVAVVAMPGDRSDEPHQLAYRLADVIIAPWPRRWYEPDWLRPHAHKVIYTGGISRFGDRPREAASPDRPNVLVVSGAGGTLTTTDAVSHCAASYPDLGWTALGVDSAGWVDDPWPLMCAATVVVGNSGQNTVADIAAAGRPSVLISGSRPFDEQRTTADTLTRAALAVCVDRWPSGSDWRPLLDAARSLDTDRWNLWETSGAAGRAARAIESIEP